MTTVPNHPVLQVAWSDTQTYCQWQGKYLPTEVQRKKTARGTDERLYAWGNDCNDAEHSNSAKRVKANTSVRSYASGASSYGALDMTGNVWEWAGGWYEPDYYARSEKSNLTGPLDGNDRVLCGGSWHHSTVISVATYRRHQPPNSRSNLMGFRRARIVVYLSEFTHGEDGAQSTLSQGS